jgi:hypothetical protein
MHIRHWRLQSIMSALFPNDLILRTISSRRTGLYTRHARLSIASSRCWALRQPDHCSTATRKGNLPTVGISQRDTGAVVGRALVQFGEVGSPAPWQSLRAVAKPLRGVTDRVTLLPQVPDQANLLGSPFTRVPGMPVVQE